VRTAACIALVALAVVPGAGAATARPSLTLVHGAPPHLRGSHFTPGSVVRIVETTSKAAIFKVRASRTGTFVLAVPKASDRCHGWLVQAIGVNGERASLGLETTQCGDAGTGDAGK
jgi:hypothetical protein